MKDGDGMPISMTASTSATLRKDNNFSDSIAVFARGRYKFWALGAILLLAFWSMLTGTFTLRWSGNLEKFDDDYYNTPATADDLDVLDLEEREKMVIHMWDVYTNSPRIRLESFWQDAFVAAYEDLTSEVPEVKEAAISEIAKMSVRYVNLDPPPLHPSSSFLSMRGLNQRQVEHRAMTSAVSKL